MSDLANQTRCADASPYPNIVISNKNAAYARYILDNVGGRNSEMTSISFYHYMSIRCKEYEDIAEIFRDITIVELKHLQLFSCLADKLGETPLLWTNCGSNKVWWSPSFADYPGDLKRILSNAVESELAAIEKYQRQMEFIDDPSVKMLLKRIVLDEEIHCQQFDQLYHAYF